MPLDPSIILGGSPAPQANPAPNFYAQYQQAIQNQLGQANAMANLQGQKLQNQAGQLQLQQAQQAQADDAAARDLFKQSSNPTDDELYAKLGPKAAGAFVKSREEAKKVRIEAQKADAEAQEKLALKAQHESDYAGHLAYAIKQADYSPIAVQHAIQQAHDAGFEKQAQMLGQLAQQNPQALPQVLDQIINQSPAQQQRSLEESKNKSTDLGRLEVGRHNAVEEFLTKARDASTTNNQEATRQQEQQRIGLEGIRTKIEGARLGVEQGRYGLEQKKAAGQAAQEDPLSVLTAGEKAMASAIANGDKKPLPQGARSGRNALINSAAYQIDPSLTDDRYTVNQSIKAGKDQDKIQAITRYTGHMEDFKKYSDQLGFSPLDMAGIHGKSGNQAQLAKAANALANEFATVTGGGKSLEEHKSTIEGLQSPYEGVRQKSVNALGELISEQYRGIYQKHKQANNGKDLDPTKYFDETTRKRLSQAGYLPSQMNPQNILPGADNQTQMGSPKSGRPSLADIFSK